MTSRVVLLNTLRFYSARSDIYRNGESLNVDFEISGGLKSRVMKQDRQAATGRISEFSGLFLVSL
jgi:hypothetical protein